MKEKDIVSAILTAAILGSANEKNEEKKKEAPNFREEAKKVGNILYATYLGFQDAGFSPEKAFQLTLAIRD